MVDRYNVENAEWADGRCQNMEPDDVDGAFVYHEEYEYLLGLLRRLEWDETGSYAHCPCCHAVAPDERGKYADRGRPKGYGHEDDCELARALR